ncbi:MAG: hypothetical protein Q7U91_14185 [Sideroxyarcus sp.]|nr:hypothetical protein [Sideroxyarcus sp.]
MHTTRNLVKPPALTALRQRLPRQLHRCTAIVVTAVFVSLLAACGGSSGSGGGVASATIDTQGGTLVGPDGVRVVIPAGALDQPTTITIARSSAGAPAVPEAYPAAGYIYELTPHGLTFNSPVTVRAPLPSGATTPLVFMASAGEDWKLLDAQVVNGFAEWQRNSFSNLLLGTACGVPVSMHNDPYWCAHSSSYARVTATPPQALVQTSPGDYYGISGDAGSYRVDQAANLQFKTTFKLPGNCTNVSVTLRRFPYQGSSAGMWGAPQIIETKSPTITTDAHYLNGTATFDFLFYYQINYVGKNLFSVVVNYDCPGVTRSYSTVTGWDYSNYRSSYVGDHMIVEGNIPAPTVFYTVGGTVSGLTGTGLVLQNNGGDNLPVTADGAFTFASAIADNAPYSVSVHTQPSGQFCALQNESGTALADVSNVAVSCVAGSAPKAWQGAALLETLDAGDAFESQVAFDANGNAFAVWSQPAVSGGKFKIWTSRYEPGSGWGNAAQIQTTDTTLDYRVPQIAFDANGDAIVAFAGFHPDGSETWAARYTAANSSWGTATQLTANGANPQIAIDTGGNAMAVWQSWNGGAYDIEARRYAAGTSTWESPQLIETNAGSADTPQIAFDAGGNAMVVWTQWGVHYDIWANRYVAGTGWGTATLIEAVDGDAGYPQIASDAAGNAMAVWEQHDGTTNSIYSNRYSAGNWGSATLVENSADFAERSSIAINGSDKAIVVWTEIDSGDVTSVWARSYVAGVGGTAVRIDDLSVYTSGGSAQIAIDAGGNAMAVWNQSYHIWANRYVAGTGWSGATLIDSTAAGGSSSTPQIAVDGNGNALAVWNHTGTSGANIWGNVFK